MGCSTSRTSFPNEIHPNLFAVTATTRSGKIAHGKLEVTSDALVLHRKRQEPINWPLPYLRRYGYEHNLFSFECGRRCASGPGVFTFRCRQAEELFLLVQTNILETRNEERLRLNALLQNVHNTMSQRHIEHVRAPASQSSNGYIRPNSMIDLDPPPSHAESKARARANSSGAAQIAASETFPRANCMNTIPNHDYQSGAALSHIPGHLNMDMSCNPNIMMPVYDDDDCLTPTPSRMNSMVMCPNDPTEPEMNDDTATSSPCLKTHVAMVHCDSETPVDAMSVSMCSDSASEDAIFPDVIPKDPKSILTNSYTNVEPQSQIPTAARAPYLANYRRTQPMRGAPRYAKYASPISDAPLMVRSANGYLPSSRLKYQRNCECSPRPHQYSQPKRTYSQPVADHFKHSYVNVNQPIDPDQPLEYVAVSLSAIPGPHRRYSSSSSVRSATTGVSGYVTIDCQKTKALRDSTQTLRLLHDPPRRLRHESTVSNHSQMSTGYNHHVVW